MRQDILERRADIEQWIAEEKPKCYICQQLNCKQETLNSYLKKMDINYAGQQNKKGQQKGPLQYKPADYYFDNGHQINSTKLRIKLIKDGYKQNKCELCGLSDWMAYPFLLNYIIKMVTIIIMI